jgi:protein involved in polysaccharide export with SLBB domain
VLAALLLCAVNAGAQAQVGPDTLPQPNVGVLRPGDQLIVRVFREDDYSGDFIIDSRGFVQIPGVGSIQAAGLEPTEIEGRIKQELVRAGLADPSLSVQVMIRVSVVGEVRDPGVKPVEPGTTLITMLAAVGGPTERADLEEAHVIRDGRPYPVNLTEAISGSATGGIKLFSNDVLVVPRKTGWTRENVTLLMGAMTALLCLANVIIASR